MKKNFTINWTYKIITPFFLFMIILPLLAQAQTIDSIKTSDRSRPFQLSFIYPLGTDGTLTKNTNYDVSLNILGGYNNGVDGFEAAGFINLNHEYVNGAQFAGFLNITGAGNLDTIQSKAWQFAGFGNINNTNVHGGQIAGFINASKELKGGQVGGFINITKESIEGAQVGGFLNVAGKGTIDAQVAGFGSFSPYVSGAQVSGFVNTAKQCKKGAQVAGFVNTALSADSSVQVAGFVNLAALNNVNTQVAGFINVGRHVSGVQLAGFINICDSIDGVPLAPISIVRYNGYRKFELSVSDFSWAQASYKMGVQDLYTIYNFSKLYGDGSRWAFGGGLGHETNWKDNMVANVELMVYQELFIGHEDAPHDIYIDRTNLVTQLKLAMGVPVGNLGHFYVAPSLNFGVARKKQNALGENIQPFWDSALVSRSAGSSDLSLWLGFSTGIRF